MIEKYFDGVLPAWTDATDPELDTPLKEHCAALPGLVDEQMDKLQFSQALAEIWKVIGECNKYIDLTQPWVLGRGEEGRPRLRTVMYNLAECVRAVAVAIGPVMPNTPAMVGEGMTAICDETTFTQEDFDYAKGIFDAIGKTRVLPERLFDGVTAISGSSPAYVYMLIEAMADAGVREGLPRTYAYEMAAQSVLGSALMVLSSGTHPAALKDAVCSPGGTTIEAVAAARFWKP